MDEQKFFILFFVILAFTFYYCDDDFYNSNSITFMSSFDSFSCRLISLGLVAFLCAAFWTYFLNNYV